MPQTLCILFPRIKVKLDGNDLTHRKENSITRQINAWSIYKHKHSGDSFHTQIFSLFGGGAYSRQLHVVKKKKKKRNSVQHGWIA